jgi:hypothetical protein
MNEPGISRDSNALSQRQGPGTRIVMDEDGAGIVLQDKLILLRIPPDNTPFQMHQAWNGGFFARQCLDLGNIREDLSRCVPLEDSGDEDSEKEPENARPMRGSASRV